MRVFLPTVLWLQTTVLSLTSGISTEDWNVTSPSLKPDVSLEDATWLSVEKGQNASSLSNSYSLLKPSSSARSEMYEDNENCLMLEPKGPKWWGTYKFVSRVGISCTGKFEPTWEAQSWSLGDDDVFLKHYNNTVKIELGDAFLTSTKPVWVRLYCSSFYKLNHYFCTAEINVTIVPGANVSCSSSDECVSQFHEHSSCHDGSCICYDGTSGLSCPPRDNNRGVIFKAVMIAVACFIAVVVSVLVIFCYNRAKTRRALRSPHLHAEGEDQRMT